MKRLILIAFLLLFGSVCYGDAFINSYMVAPATPPVVYSSDLCSGGTASGDSGYGVGGEPYRAFDNDVSTTWMNGGVPHWIKYDFGSGNAHAVCKLALINGNTFSSWSKDFTVEGSNNDSDWTSLYSGTCADVGGARTVQEFAFTNGTAYRYVRITVTSSYYSLSQYFSLFTEIQMMEIVE